MNRERVFSLGSQFLVLRSLVRLKPDATYGDAGRLTAYVASAFRRTPDADHRRGTTNRT
jgi:hypothetical protein